MVRYGIVLAVMAIAASVALYLRRQAKRAAQELEARRRALEREARLLERRRKPRNPR